MRAEYNKMYAPKQDEHLEIYQQLEYMSFKKSKQSQALFSIWQKN